MKVAIIGAGASGLMLGGLLTQKGYDVTIFDGNEKAGKKLYITGKGRCNITNLCDVSDFLNNVVRGEKFLRSAIYSFSPQDTVNFFENLGLKTKVERGNRVFPLSDKSNDVIKALLKHCKDVKFEYNSKVEKIVKTEKGFEIILKKVENKKEKNVLADYIADKVVIATGGESYKATGSDGSGYILAKSFGHTIEKLVPALCPIKLKEDLKELEGLSLKNVSLKADIDGKKKEIFGEMLFTDKGISGPIALSMSSFINRAGNVKLSLDLKPALTEEQLEKRLLRDFDSNKNKNLSYILKGLMPNSLSIFFAKKCGLNLEKKVHDILKEERKIIIDNLKSLSLSYNGLYPIDAGIITSGGVSLKEVNPKTFESKLVKDLYFVGEILDIDALTGGFNLQIAFATSYSCAKNMWKSDLVAVKSFFQHKKWQCHREELAFARVKRSLRLGLGIDLLYYAE